MLKITHIYDWTNPETAIPWCSLEYNHVLKWLFIGCCFVSTTELFIVRFSITLTNFHKICGIPEKQHC